MGKWAKKHQDHRSISLHEKTYRGLLNKELVDFILFEVKSGKEAKIYLAHKETHPHPILIKIFSISLFTNRHRCENFVQDARFNNRQKGTSDDSISLLWTSKEYRNLRRLQIDSVFFRVPKVLSQFRNSLILECVLKHPTLPPSSPINITLHDLAPTLTEYLRSTLPPSVSVQRQLKGLYKQALLSYIEIFKRGRLIHGDFSGENILVAEGGSKVVVIDFAQSVLVEASEPFKLSRLEKEYLIRDLKRVNSVFRNALMKRKETFKAIGGLALRFVLEELMEMKADCLGWKEEIEGRVEREMRRLEKVSDTESREERCADKAFAVEYLNSIGSLQWLDEEEIFEGTSKIGMGNFI